MQAETVIETRAFEEATIASLRKYDMPATPANYALWYAYHAGESPNLQRTIDVIISNNTGFSEATLHDLHATFLSSVKEEEAVRETAVRILETLRSVIDITDRAQADADHFGAALSGLAGGDLGKNIGNLRELIENLVSESRRMAARSQNAGARMRESASKIHILEDNLASALRDATLDGLTGVANRRSFDVAIRRLAGDAMNSGDDLALLMIDIDHFKQVNDNWGHQIGDEVLCHVAATLQKSVRGEDCVTRYGGEEFAIILPRTDTAAAVTVAENIRQTLSRIPFRGETVPPMRSITISIGASCYEPGDALTEWVGRSDAALYAAKKEGRNCVRVA